MKNKKSPRRSRSLMLGIAAGDDGHKRITQGDGFAVVGGTDDSHGRATETLIKAKEELARKGRSFDNADPREIADAIHKHS